MIVKEKFQVFVSYAFVAKCLKLSVLAAMKTVKLYDIKFS